MTTTAPPPPQQYGVHPAPAYYAPAYDAKETTPLVQGGGGYGGGGYADDGTGANNYWQQTPHDIRMDFIRKVYGILSAQLLLAAVICTIAMVVPAITSFLTAHTWMVWVFFGFSLITLIALFFFSKTYPANLILLFTFTAFLAAEVAVICALYSQANMILTVVAAFGMTMVVFISLSIFVTVSKIDFDFLGPFLFVGLIVLMIFGIITMFFGFQLRIIYAACGTVLFSGFIIYDTHQVINKLGCDDYVMGAVELFLDIFNLFLMILELMGGGRR